MGGQLWEVVGGGDKGGILVREGQDLASQQLGGRLATGALVEEVALIGERLHFRRLTGRGPDAGWVSVKLKDKELLVPVASDAPAAEAAAVAPGGEVVAEDEAAGAEAVRALLDAGEPNGAESRALELLRGCPAGGGRLLRRLRLEAVLHPAFEAERSPAPASKRDPSALAQAQVAEEPESPEAQVLLGRALCWAGKRQEAEVALKSAAERQGAEGEARQMLRALVILEDEKARGNVAFKDGKWEAACEAYTRALDADSYRLDRAMDSAVLGNRSAARRKLGDPAAALQDAAESLRLSPTYTKARFRKATALMELCEYADALLELKAVAAEDPKMAGLDEWMWRARHWSSPECADRKTRNHYSLLGAPMDATLDELKKAHKAASLKWHPDKHSEDEKVECEEMFKAIQESWEFLQNEAERYQYDFGRKKPTPAELKPMPRALQQKGWTVRKGDGIETCMCCGFVARSDKDKAIHLQVQGHPGFNIFFKTKGME